MILLDISNGWKTIIMIIAMIAVMYLFLIKPQRDQQKKDAAYREGLKKGDSVMTAGGIHGSVVSNETGHIVIEVAPGVRIKVGKSNVMPIPGTETK